MTNTCAFVNTHSVTATNQHYKLSALEAGLQARRRGALHRTASVRQAGALSRTRVESAAVDNESLVAELQAASHNAAAARQAQQNADARLAVLQVRVSTWAAAHHYRHGAHADETACHGVASCCR